MIQVTGVHGDVLVQDVKNQYMQMATTGMRLDPMGSYLIVTTSASRAELLAGGGRVSLPPSSMMRIRGDRTWWERHSEAWSGDVKLFFGRLWAKIAREHKDDPEAANAVIGVRG